VPSASLRYAVLASGGGSNFQVLLDHSSEDHASAGHLPAQAVFAASNNSGSRALERARAAGVPAYHVSARTEGSEEAVAARLTALLDEYAPDLLVLAGYMKKVPDAVLERMKNRIVNIHPALLPDFGGAGFYGEKVHEAVVREGRAFSGMTIHMVNGEYDKGRVVLQRRAQIPPGADAAEVGRLVLALEHDSFWRVLKGFAEGDIVATDSNDPAQAVRVRPEWEVRMRALGDTVFP
jgi:phosphoribosylglycinamide formyltransferase-1